MQLISENFGKNWASFSVLLWAQAWHTEFLGQITKSVTSQRTTNGDERRKIVCSKYQMKETSRMSKSLQTL